ncbi:methylenetetrahydrofolate reductase [Yunchengibacter salinarum]|uniref:methylenetetrahydrofolate reductase n=1 Tax=Yunchengibacter salinarum TaxID=3133399 RepID=UPI0035B680A2
MAPKDTAPPAPETAPRLPDTAQDLPPLRALLQDVTVEATPAQIDGEADMAALLPSGSSVYIPFLPGGSVEPVIRASAQVRARGLVPVPHVPARTMPSRAALDDFLARLREAGADRMLLIAGDTSTPRGPFASTLDLLETGLPVRHGFRMMGVAGHPEGHPVADDDTLFRALLEKRAYARETGTEMWIVTQFIFTSEPLFHWLDRLAVSGLDLPVRVGVPGPTRLKTLIRMAMACGVGQSARMLAKRPDMVGRLFSRWTPDDLVGALAGYRARWPEHNLAGMHVFPFGGLRVAATWLDRLRSGEESVPVTVPETGGSTVLAGAE